MAGKNWDFIITELTERMVRFEKSLVCGTNHRFILIL